MKASKANCEKTENIIRRTEENQENIETCEGLTHAVSIGVRYSISRVELLTYYLSVISNLDPILISNLDPILISNYLDIPRYMLLPITYLGHGVQQFDPCVEVYGPVPCSAIC